jgi:hypothetical protein
MCADANLERGRKGLFIGLTDTHGAVAVKEGRVNTLMGG